MTGPIDAVVFDVGGVLCGSPPEAFARVDAEHGLPPRTVEQIFRTGPLWAEVEVGRMTLSAFLRRCVATIRERHGVTVAEARLEAMLHDCTAGSVRADMVALLREVKASGHRTGILSNIYAECRPWLRTFCGEGAVDVICDSSEVGLRKPDPAVYRKLLDMLGAPAEAVVFVDDFPENLAPAAELGFVTVLYASPAQVRAELRAAGVAVAP